MTAAVPLGIHAEIGIKLGLAEKNLPNRINIAPDNNILKKQPN